MKYFSVVILLFLFHSQNVLAQQKLLVDKLGAQVGAELILMSDVENEYNYLASMQKTTKPEMKCLILEQIIVSKILVTQAKLDSLEVEDDEVETQLDARMDQILRQMGGDESLFESYYGKTVAEMKNVYREDIRSKILADKMQGQLMSNIQITPSEVIDFFNSVPVDSLPYFNSEVEVGEIVYTPKLNETEKKKAREKLENIRNEILAGTGDFAELAKKHSDDFGSGRQGGNLGWQKRGSFVPEFEAVAYSLKKDELSEIVETEFGYHLIQVMERRGNTINGRHILIKPRMTPQDLAKAKAELDSIRTLIVDGKLSFDAAVKKFSDKNSMSYHNNGRMTNQKNQSTFFETKDLSPEIYFALEDLEIGEISQPLEIKSQSGETQYQLIKLLTRTKPHRANLKEDYSRIQEFAKESKKSEYINDWLQDKIKSNYIFIDDYYLNACPSLKSWISK
ncbi:MAG TPA: peptidylprolyl isomerase [Saprospirales bacterium]|nr:peptidylprolyl isomerase [Saprospirales bacterium]HAY70827.1 peptidylprolyl isomerase [Saprospirales bacterium]HRQ29651.1 peptidylprolyl isomerase [Saprospiraceae bacterium]